MEFNSSTSKPEPIHLPKEYVLRALSPGLKHQGNKVEFLHLVLSLGIMGNLLPLPMSLHGVILNEAQGKLCSSHVPNSNTVLFTSFGNRVQPLNITKDEGSFAF
jgi:hypothetical protein